MLNKEQETALEEAHLQETLAIAGEQLKKSRAAAEAKEEEILEAKRAVREDSTHSLTNLYASDDFEALIELSQYMNPITESVADYEEEQRKIARLENIIKSPYFARIDFCFEGEAEAEKVYIGRSSLKKDNAYELHVYDWRSPIASVFYRFMSGKAFYEAPVGTVHGEVSLKRQFEIKNGRLEYFFDADRNISDEFLRQLLSKNTSPQMKAIVETIQKEQDVVIRDMENDLLMVQGVAGSGKTSIALHRAAYLMYQDLQSKLTANSIMIISPNSAFEEYISDVLPELGEENVTSAVFDDVLHKVLRERRIQSKNEFLEHAVTNGRFKEIIKKSMECKTSETFRKVLEQFLSEIPLRFMEFHDIYYHGKLVADVRAMREWVLRRPGTPLGMRLKQLENFVLELAFGTAAGHKYAEDKNRIRQEIQGFTQFDIVELYKKFFYDRQYFNALVQEVGSRESLVPIWKYTRENLETGCLYYDDAIAITYLYLRIYGMNAYRNIRQVVIDEAQDYYLLQYEIFRLLFPNAKFTILGDINQTLAKKEDVSLYEQIQKILQKEKATLITLDKSFRCTNEILNFSLQFIAHRPEIESFNRKGEEPEIAAFSTRDALADGIVQEVAKNRELGYQTICLICKNERNAVRLYEALQGKMELGLVREDDVESLEGTFIMPVYQSKGLEFDAVILCDVDAENYQDEDDRKLLYVECTRALHRLSVFCEGEMSSLVSRR